MMNQDNVVNDVRAMLEGAKAPVTDECCIYKVPFDICKLNEDAYTPKVVTIGPFHHNGNPRLQDMETYKLIYCNAFIKRSNTSLERWVSYIEEVEPKFRSSYSDALEFSKEELVKIIVADSGFIFELFWCAYYDEWSEKNGTFLLKPWLTTNIRLDLLLLENQLPFFVLDGLFKLSFPSISGGGDPLQTRIETDESGIHLPSATELLEAGVKFKTKTESVSVSKKNTKNVCLLDLKFSGRVLEIPQFRVEDWTELLFRNMMALEQCHYPYQSYITDYVAVLDFLINTSRDVDILVQKGVLVNWLGDSDSVANMFNGLWKNITHINFSSHYFNLCKDLNAFCRDPWHKLRSTLRRDYCNTPWQTAVSLAGIVLLFLSLVQSVCSVLQVI